MRVREPIRQKVIDKEKNRAYSDLERQLSDLTEPQLKIVAALDAPRKHVDDLIQQTGLPAAQVLSELTMLQLLGSVSQEPGKRFTLNVASRS